MWCGLDVVLLVSFGDKAHWAEVWKSRLELS